MKVWADATFGMVGRSPDYLNTVLMTFAEGADFFGQRGAMFADNVQELLQVLPRPRSLPHPRHRQSAERPFARLARAGERLRPSGRGGGGQGRPDRPRRQDAGDPWTDRGRAHHLSAARHSRRRGALRAGVRGAGRHARAALHLPRAVRRRRAIGMGPSARRALRGARRGLRVRRRAGAVGPRLSLRRREDGQRAVRAGERAQPHRPPDRHPRAGEMPDRDRRRRSR